MQRRTEGKRNPVAAKSFCVNDTMSWQHELGIWLLMKATIRCDEVQLGQSNKGGRTFSAVRSSTKRNETILPLVMEGLPSRGNVLTASLRKSNAGCAPRFYQASSEMSSAPHNTITRRDFAPEWAEVRPAATDARHPHPGSFNGVHIASMRP